MALLFDLLPFYVGEEVYSYTIVTTSVSSQLEFLHNRMPVILRGDNLDTWINSNAKWSEKIADILKPFEETLEWWVPSTVQHLDYSIWDTKCPVL